MSSTAASREKARGGIRIPPRAYLQRGLVVLSVLGVSVVEPLLIELPVEPEPVLWRVELPCFFVAFEDMPVELPIEPEPDIELSVPEFIEPDDVPIELPLDMPPLEVPPPDVPPAVCANAGAANIAAAATATINLLISTLPQGQVASMLSWRRYPQFPSICPLRQSRRTN